MSPNGEPSGCIPACQTALSINTDVPTRFYFLLDLNTLDCYCGITCGNIITWYAYMGYVYNPPGREAVDQAVQFNVLACGLCSRHVSRRWERHKATQPSADYRVQSWLLAFMLTNSAHDLAGLLHTHTQTQVWRTTMGQPALLLLWTPPPWCGLCHMPARPCRPAIGASWPRAWKLLA